MSRVSYEEKLKHAKNPTAQRLLLCMLEKQTNLCASLDVGKISEVLSISEQIGSDVCMVKIHADALSDVSIDALLTLQELSEKNNFLIFEDRKFADIGSTVRMQYAEGPYRIVEWSDITNAHILPGPGIIEGLSEVGMPHHRGLLLLAEMSSHGALMDEQYRKTAYEWAEKYSEFVIGFIGKGRTEAPQYLIMCTPGIHLEALSDGLGQQYQSPIDAIAAGTDVIIVGRGIYGSGSAQTASRHYREIGWDAYTQAMRG
ncbi:MAG: orotidine-5'-phosphate decarboxylase [Candidatus Kerfeldbacteria bacterium]|nr:orotidine-5'-phosphate decarboxylase [Candidatus Kerfeldbacteria bacterium]